MKQSLQQWKVLHTDPEQLPEEHHHLLFSDFSALTAGPINFAGA
jgi:hypothetical protein